MSTCRRCDLLHSEVWRLAQRLAEMDRRLERLERTVDRLTTPARRGEPAVRVRLGAVRMQGDLPQ